MSRVLQQAMDIVLKGQDPLVTQGGAQVIAPRYEGGLSADPHPQVTLNGALDLWLDYPLDNRI